MKLGFRISAYTIIASILLFILIIGVYIYNEKEAQYYKNLVSKADNSLNSEELSVKKDFETVFSTDVNAQRARGEKIAAKIYMLIFPYILIYNVKINGEPARFSKFHVKTLNDNYVAPEYAMELADAIIGYGVYDNAAFEDDMSMLFNIPAYTFDCGVKNLADIRYPITGNNIFFESECIGTDKFLIKDQISSNKIHTFGEKLKELNLLDKKVYVKLDIAGSEYEVMPDILNYSDNITGISLIIHMENPESFLKTNELLEQINKKFTLVAKYPAGIEGDMCNLKHCNQYSTDMLPKAISLTYINNNLVDSKYLPINQSNPRYKIYSEYDYFDKNSDVKTELHRIHSSFLISPVVPLVYKIRNFFRYE